MSNPASSRIHPRRRDEAPTPVGRGRFAALGGMEALRRTACIAGLLGLGIAVPGLARQPDAVPRPPIVESGDLLTVVSACGFHLELKGSDSDRLSYSSSAPGPGGRKVGVSLRPVEGGWMLEICPGADPSEGHHGLRLEVETPRWLSIEIDSPGGPLHASGLSGSLSGSTGAGPILLRDLRGASIDLRTGAGEVSLRDSEAYGRLETGAGPIRLDNVVGDVAALSPRGTVAQRDVTFRPRPGSSPGNGGSGDVPPESQPIELVRRSGHLRLERVPAGSRLETGSGHVEVGSASGPLEVTLGSGNLHIGALQGSLEARVNAGSIHVRVLPDRPTPAGGRADDGRAGVGPGRIEPAVLDLRTFDGDVRLELPAGLELTVEGELVYRSRRGRPRIDSDLPLELGPEEPLLRPRPFPATRADRRLPLGGRGVLPGGPSLPGPALRLRVSAGGNLEIRAYRPRTPSETGG
ncbi:MAG: hypothetical protein MI919_17490 [Holophagales bacterium]|nr:hypothetical protein [Holophagales bacterium]